MKIIRIYDNCMISHINSNPEVNKWMGVDSIPQELIDNGFFYAIVVDGDVIGYSLFSQMLDGNYDSHVAFLPGKGVYGYKHYKEILNKFFDDSGKDVLVTHTPSDNVKALKAVKHIGFVETSRIEGIPLKRNKNTTIVISVLHRSILNGN